MSYSSGFLKFFPFVFGVMLFVVLLVLGKVSYDTLIENPPFQTFSEKAEIVQYPAYNAFVYRRELTIKYDIYGFVDRFVLHSPSGRTIQVDPTSGQMYKQAFRRPVYREFRLPTNMEKGEWCLFAYLRYQPGWSLKEHVFEAPAVCAEVK